VLLRIVGLAAFTAPQTARIVAVAKMAEVQIPKETLDIFSFLPVFPHEFLLQLGLLSEFYSLGASR
jgi:hypothetical protein